MADMIPITSPRAAHGDEMRRLAKAKLENLKTVWATVFLILLSVVMHGATVTPAMRWIDHRRGVDQLEPVGCGVAK